MTQANHVFIITLSIIALGFFLKKYRFISEADGKVISRFLMHTTFPALMLVSMSRVQLTPSLFLIPLFCIGFCGLMLMSAFLWFRNYSNAMRGVLTMGAGTANVGLFGFPIIEGLFGQEALVYAVMYDIGNTIIAFGVVYPIGTYFASGGTRGVDWRAILKRVFSLPPFLALFVGLLINVLKLPQPKLLYDGLDLLASANKSLVLLLMGIYLSFALDKDKLKAIAKVLTIRYVAGLAAVVGLYFLLPPDAQMRSVLIICVLLPIGMTILPFSDEMNFDSRIAGTLLNISLLISFGLMWGMVLMLGLR